MMCGLRCKKLQLNWEAIVLKKLKNEVYEANLSLVKHGLVLFTWGNVSAYDKQSGFVVIKPSGVDYKKMRSSDMVVVDLNGNIVEGKMKPSSDTPTHIEIYRAFSGVGAIVHTHSKWATALSQSRTDIPCLGTTHADNFYGDIPCTRLMTPSEIKDNYEKNTGLVIIDTFKSKNIDPLQMGAVIVANHGPFSWGNTCKKAVENSIVMEYVAEMAFIAISRNPETKIQQELVDKHYLRKHGDNAYYGQK